MFEKATSTQNVMLFAMKLESIKSIAQ